MANISFVTSYCVALYSFYTAVLADPGFVPRLHSREEQKQVYFELFIMLNQLITFINLNNCKVYKLNDISLVSNRSFQ